MNNWTAPVLVFVLGTAVSLLVGEPGAIFLVAALSLMGYGINKAGN